MNNHKLLTKLAIIMALLLGVGAFSANTNVQTVSAARTHHRKHTRTRHRKGTRTRHRKGKYIKDFCVYHVRKGVKGYDVYDFDMDQDDFKFELTNPIHYHINHANGGTIIAPTNSHTKYELKTVTKNGTPVKARPVIFNFNGTMTGGWFTEKTFRKLFAKGGSIHADDLYHPFTMKNHRLYGSSYSLYHNTTMESTSPESTEKLEGKTPKRAQEELILSEIQNEHLDASGKWVDFSPETGVPIIDKATNDHEVARINKALKKLGYSDSLINKIWKFQRYRLDYTDVDTPYLINPDTGKSKFLLD